MIRVLIVDDSAFMRRMLKDMIEASGKCEIAGIGKNGADAVRLAAELEPDVVTLDVEMPVMNGLQALQSIMESARPVPVVMISSLTQEGAEATILALQYGAVDFVAKPSGSISLDLHKVQQQIVEKVVLAASVKKIKRIRKERPIQQAQELPLPKYENHSHVFHGITAIGTSTGGPRALKEVIGALPGGYPHPVVVVQHMPPKFTASLAARLDQNSVLSVCEAKHHQVLEAGHVYVAPGGRQMEVEAYRDQYRIVLSDQPAVNGHRPSVDVLFDSVRHLCGLHQQYVIMTGMGGDGAKAMQRAKNAIPGAVTIAEAEETCVVYGMPRTAVELKCVDMIVPLQRIASKLVRLAGEAESLCSKRKTV